MDRPLIALERRVKSLEDWRTAMSQPMPPQPPPPTTPPPTGSLTPSGGIILGEGNNPISGKRIVGQKGIDGPLGKNCNLALSDSEIESVDYCIIISNGALCEVLRTNMRSKGGGENNYGIRTWGCVPRIIGKSPTERNTLSNFPGGKALLRLGGFTSAGEIAYYHMSGSMSWCGSSHTSLKWDPSVAVCGPCDIHDCTFMLMIPDLPELQRNEWMRENHSLFEIIRAVGWKWKRCDFIIPEGFFVFASWADRPECRGHSFEQCRVKVYSDISTLARYTWEPMSHNFGRGGAAKNAAGVSIP